MVRYAEGEVHKRFEELFGFKLSGIPRLQNLERQIVKQEIDALAAIVKERHERLHEIEKGIADEDARDRRTQLHTEAVSQATVLEEEEARLGTMRDLATRFKLGSED